MSKIWAIASIGEVKSLFRLSSSSFSIHSDRCSSQVLWDCSSTFESYLTGSISARVQNRGRLCCESDLITISNLSKRSIWNHRRYQISSRALFQLKFGLISQTSISLRLSIIGDRWYTVFWRGYHNNTQEYKTITQPRWTQRELHHMRLGSSFE